jgi:hypothetical protein
MESFPTFHALRVRQLGALGNAHKVAIGDGGSLAGAHPHERLGSFAGPSGDRGQRFEANAGSWLSQARARWRHPEPLFAEAVLHMMGVQTAAYARSFAVPRRRCRAPDFQDVRDGQDRYVQSGCFRS